MVIVPITQAMLAEAQALANNIPRLNNSITAGQGTLAGCLGEIATRDYFNQFGFGAQIEGDYQFDISLRDGTKIEVKTKRCTSVPKPEYECSVANYNQRQACDFYVFTRVSQTHVYLLGFISRADFYSKSRQMRAGQSDANVLATGDRFTFHADCRNITIAELDQLEPPRYLPVAA